MRIGEPHARTDVSRLHGRGDARPAPMHRLADGVDPDVITTVEAAAGSVPGVIHAHARARWTGRTLRVEVEGWVDPDLTARDADALGRLVADEISRQLPEAGSLTWATRPTPA
jgi:divalent metal cation (Fe/Co/Zn/Cd) transporter